MKTKLSSLLILTFLLLSCNEDNNIIVDNTNLLIGNWNNVNWNEGELIFNRVEALEDNNYGVSFKENNIFVNRTSGWCGTPPLSFFDVVGSYKYKDSVIAINSNDHMGNYGWRVITLDQEKLVVKFLDRN